MNSKHLQRLIFIGLLAISFTGQAQSFNAATGKLQAGQIATQSNQIVGLDQNTINAIKPSASSGRGFSDTVFQDSNNQLFVYRDTGSGTPLAYSIPNWTEYSPVAPIKATSSTLTNYAQETGGNLAAILAKINAGYSVSVSNQPTSLAVTQATGSNLHAVIDSGSVNATISGTPSVSVSNLPATQAVSASSLPLPVGAATSANQPAINADGGSLAHITNLPVTQAVSGSVSVNNLPQTQPVSGTVAVSNQPTTLSVTQSAGSNLHTVVDSGTVSISNLPSTQAISGSVTANAGTNLNTSALALEAGGNLAQVATNTALTNAGTSATKAAPIQGVTGGIAVPVSGSISVSNLPATQAVSGSVSVSNLPATQAVSGSVSVSNLPATQAVSAASLPLPTGAATAANQPVINADGGAQAHIMNFPATQAVSGSVSVSNQPTTLAVTQPTAANLNATVVGTGTLAVQNTAAVVGGNTVAVKVDNSGVTQPVSGSVSVSNFPATQAVTGTFWQATQPVSGSVSVSNQPTTLAVTQSTAANLNATIVGTGTLAVQNTAAVVGGNATAVKVDGSAVTQPVSGTFWPTTQPVSGSVSVSNFPTNQAVSDAQNLPIQGVTNLTVGTPAVAGRMLAINCTSGGNVSVTFADSSTFVFPVMVGFQTLPFAVTQINTSGTTASATYTNLK